MEKESELFYAESRAAWRAWLQAHHATASSVWLLYYRKTSAVPSLSWSEAVDEALCFGWIDSKTQKLDEERFRQFFCPRKPRSVWSKINKDKIVRLGQEGLMTPAGYAVIERARQDGSWTILDEVEALIIPPDLEAEFGKWPRAQGYFRGLSRTDQRNILQWLVLAKRPETRKKRITEIAELAHQQQKPKQFR
ncbi:YdeI/OmpD-associated family protein [Neolewinella lacunae]|uniref:YdeI/OmpD-associated family protein n=1 Tax=Neolewinella lacunae TaxID=1517758 RepID=A0A923PK11_9BACT|nr:YdeI/OmpD-associated family protein [Neolewinella lacunae]MBC6994769.1 YdeI/OmpD-associated family protein [Neolewinella lacunae]MDN3634391.1 YdeI/OmpD-associated family protein [Neolewinella lacunae]